MQTSTKGRYGLTEKRSHSLHQHEESPSALLPSPESTNQPTNHDGSSDRPAVRRVSKGAVELCRRRFGHDAAASERAAAAGRRGHEAAASAAAGRRPNHPTVGGLGFRLIPRAA